MRFRYIIITIFSLLCFTNVQSQPTYEHISNQGIYSFLDEMANEQLIEINTTIKPYTRSLILEKLKTTEENQDKLNTRQRRELDFYLRDYGLADESTTNPYQGNSRLDLINSSEHFATSLHPLGLTYKDSLFTFGIRPIWGIEYLSNDNDGFSRTWGGGRIYGKIGDNLGFYASLRDNHMTHVLSRPGYFTQREGGVYKGNDLGGGDYSEMRGGITYNWKWGRVALVKDHLMWGDNYNGSNINNGKYPSFGMIKLHLNPAEWFEFNYFHGWLVSEVIDSSRSYMPESGFERPVYKPKYMAANMFTVKPIREVSFSFGNSIIYGDIDMQPAYLIPFMFFKSIDHTISANIENQNSQMFANLSIRPVKHLHLYGSLFIDEFSFTRINDPNRHNFNSWKGGIRLSNWPIDNVSLTYETTKTLPLTFKHRIPVLTYTTNEYNLGHYLKANSYDHYVELSVRPFQRFHFKAGYLHAAHGNEYPYIKRDTPLDELPYMEDKTWDNTTITLKANYEFTANSYIFAGYTYRNIQGYSVDNNPANYYLSRYTHEMFHGETWTFRFGFNLGF
ncbi:MAG: hypothetical protein R6U04_07055 [Bacteroidales bacterium]